MDDQQNEISAEASTASCSLMTPDATDSPMLTGPEVDPVNAAAHLQLLGESLSHIGHRLQGTKVGWLNTVGFIVLTLKGY